MSEANTRFSDVADIYTRGSIVLRDLFAYLFSGALFVVLSSPWATAIAHAYGLRITAAAVASIAWLLVIAVIVVSFALGHVFSALWFLLFRPTKRDYLPKEMKVFEVCPVLYAYFVERYNVLMLLRRQYASAFLALALLHFGIGVFLSVASRLSLCFAVLYLILFALLAVSAVRTGKGFYERLDQAYERVKESR